MAFRNQRYRQSFRSEEARSGGPSRNSDAFDVKLSAEERRQLAADLSTAIEDAVNARAHIIADGGKIDLLDWFYEQGRSAPEDRPFPGAADLTSWFITENVDAIRAYTMGAITSGEPFCIVEGWGDAAQNAPAVEEFHDWQVDEEGLIEELAKVVHGAYLEDCHILEVRERVETKRITEELDVALEVNDDGGVIFDTNGRPKMQIGPDGGPVEAQEGQPSARIKRTYTKTRRLGPEYDVISMKDFVFLPGHARNKRQVWGYAYRFWSRIPEIQEKADDGLYDADAVNGLGEQSDREGARNVQAPVVSEVAPQTGPAVEKELWQLSIKRDLDGDGREEWYVATLSTQHRELLRLKLDTFVMKVGKPRCVPFVPFLRRNAVYGYSYAEKLLTLAEEHTALRNMAADRGALATNAPMTVLQGALYDPDEQPFGVGRSIIVRDHNELRPMVIPDVPNSIVEQKRDLVQAKERVGLLSDMAIGVQANAQRTLGENQMVQRGSAVRVDEPVKAIQRSISTVMELRHQIWIDTLEADANGLEIPADRMARMQMRGIPASGGRFTAAMLKGKFKFKPSGSTETADKGRNRQDFNNAVLALANLAKVFPGLALMFQNPEVTKAVIEEWARVYNVRNRQKFLGALQVQPGVLPAAAGMDAAGATQPDAQPPEGMMPPALQALMASMQGGGAPMAGAGPEMMGEESGPFFSGSY